MFKKILTARALYDGREDAYHVKLPFGFYFYKDPLQWALKKGLYRQLVYKNKNWRWYQTRITLFKK